MGRRSGRPGAERSPSDVAAARRQAGWSRRRTPASSWNRSSALAVPAAPAPGSSAAPPSASAPRCRDVPGAAAPALHAGCAAHRPADPQARVPRARVFRHHPSRIALFQRCRTERSCLGCAPDSRGCRLVQLPFVSYYILLSSATLLPCNMPQHTQTLRTTHHMRSGGQSPSGCSDRGPQPRSHAGSGRPPSRPRAAPTKGSGRTRQERVTRGGCLASASNGTPRAVAMSIPIRARACWRAPALPIPVAKRV